MKWSKDERNSVLKARQKVGAGMRGIVFDLDGVLTDTAEYHYQAWKALGEKIGIPFDRAFNENLKGISRMDSLERILELGHKENDYTQAEKEVLASDKNEHYKELILEITPKDLLPGIKAFIEAAKARGLRLALASASKNGPVILERLGMTDYFEAVVDPSTLEHGKPDPEIFTKGAELLGLPAEECVGIEDAQAGIAAINAAGMFSVGVGSAESMKEADLFVESTADLDLDEIMRAAAAK